MVNTTEENLKLFDTMIIEGKATWWQMELPSGNVIFGNAKAEMLGYSPNQFSHYEDFTKLLHPDDYEATMNAMRKHMQGEEKAYKAIYRIKNNQEIYITFFDYGHIVKKEGENITVIGFVLKVGDVDNPSEETLAFEKLITSGEVSLIDLFSRARE